MRCLKHTFILLLISIGISQAAKAQLVVQDLGNFKQAAIQIKNQLTQIEKLRKQVQNTTRSLQYAKQSFENRIQDLQSLRNRNWNSFDNVAGNLRLIKNSINRMERTKDFLNAKYVQLYDRYKRTEMKKNNPEKARRLSEQDITHTSAGLLGTSKITAKNISKYNTELNYIKRDYENSDGGSQVARETSVKIQAMTSQQLIEVRRLIAQQNELLSKKEINEILEKQSDREVSEARENLQKKGAKRRLEESKKGNTSEVPSWWKRN